MSESPHRGWAWASHLRTIWVALVLALTIRAGIAQAYVVEGPSMEPTLLDGQRVLVSKFPFGFIFPSSDHAVLTWATPEVGEVVIVRSPRDGTDLVKRVIGLPGDRIRIDSEVVYRNGVALTTGIRGLCDERFGNDCEWTEERMEERRWRTRRSVTSVPETHDAVIVPAGHLFVLGDHRDRSNDSRYFGPVAADRVVGRVEFLD